MNSGLTPAVLRAGRDELQPTAIGSALLARIADPAAYFSTQAKALSSTQNKEMLRLLARGWPPISIGRKLGIDAQLVAHFATSSINARRIEELRSQLKKEDPTNTVDNPDTFYKDAEVLTRDKLLDHALHGSDYVSLAAVKAILDRALGKPVERLKVQHEHSLAGMLEDIYARREQALGAPAPIDVTPQKEEYP